MKDAPPLRAAARAGLLAALAGAGLLGLLDAALRIPLDTSGFWREATLVVVAGDLAVAALLWSLLAWLRRALRPAAAFHLGLAVGLGPLLSFKLHAAWLWWPFALSCLLLLPWLLRHRRAAPPAWSALPAPLLCLALAWTTPSLEPRLPAAGLDAAEFAAERPDLVLISCDTLRADAVADPRGPLPHLAAMRAEGCWADYALSTSCSTRPGHVSMLSGLGAMGHAVASNENRVEVGALLLAERLAAAGYRTAGVVSNAVIQGGSGFQAGFEVFDDSPVAKRGPREAFLALLAEHTWLGRLGLDDPPAPLAHWLFGRGSTVTDGDRGNGRHTTDRALALLGELQRGAAPYFLFVHYMDPHAPYWPPAETAGVYAPGAALPERFRGSGLADGERALIHRLGEEIKAGSEEARADLAAERLLYDEEVLFVDRMLGELRARIAAGGRPTLVLFTADHGEHFGEHGFVLHRNSLYEPLVRVPFMLAGAGVRPRRMERPPQLEDVVPTFLAAAGLPRDGLVGRDLRVEDPPERPHFERYQSLLALRDGGWKLHCELVPDAAGRLRAEPRALYHLAADPAELDDRLAAEPERAARLLEAAQRVLATSEASRPGGIDADPLHQQALRALGYVDEG